MSKTSPTEPDSLISSYQVSQHVRYGNVDGRLVILDLRDGKYFIFDEVASYMWETLLTLKGSTECINHITKHFKISQSQCKQDLDAFIENCKKRGLFAIDGAKTQNNSAIMIKYHSPNVLNAWKCIYLTRRSLARAGFSTTYDLHSRMIKPEIGRGRDADMSLSVAVQAFQRAENFFSTKDVGIDCLPRSLALHRFLLSVGIDANHYIGVRSFPFGAHAWVKVKGTPVCDTEAFVSKFNEISRV